MIRLRLNSDSAVNVRFAISPATQTQLLVRLIGRHSDPTNAPEPWVRNAAANLSSLDVGELVEVMSSDYSWPGFLAPVPPAAANGEALQWQLAAASATPPDRVEREIETAFQGRSIPTGPLHSGALARDVLATQLSRVFHSVMEPMWRQVGAILRTDLTLRSHQTSEGGLSVALNRLNPSLRFNGQAIEYASVHDHEVAVPANGEGLVLVPILFARHLAVEDQPARGPMHVMYPARGSGLLYEEADDKSNSALIEVLGATRVAILTAADVPITTTDVAARLDLAPGSVSIHLTTMTAVGWLNRTRVGKRVFYELSSLGRVILNRTIDQGTKSESA